MKKTIRKIMALALCLMLLLSMSTMVSAATVRWGSGTNQRTLVLNTTSTTQLVEVSTCLVYTHMKGTATTMRNGSAFSYTRNATHGGDYLQFQTYVLMAMDQEGIQNSYTGVCQSGATYQIKATMPTGNYRMYMLFSCKNGTWGVTTDGAARAVSTGSGTISLAPTGSYTLTARTS